MNLIKRIKEKIKVNKVNKTVIKSDTTSVKTVNNITLGNFSFFNRIKQG